MKGMINVNDKNYDSNNVNKITNGGYTSDEMNNKYRFQKRWQEKNGYIVKSYRLNEETIKNLLKFSEENDMSQASILRNAFQRYKERTKLDVFLRFTVSPQDKKCDIKKGFKITKEFAEEIESVGKRSGHTYGYFVTKILDDYMEEENKTKNKSINEQNKNP